MSHQKFSIRNYTTIFVTLLVLVMTVLDVTLVNVALPVMSEKFGVSDSQSVWIITVYQLVITMLLLPVSSYGDRTSYRRCFLVGVAIFTISSALCAASRSFYSLVAARALQGVGAACVMGVNISLYKRPVHSTLDKTKDMLNPAPRFRFCAVVLLLFVCQRIVPMSFLAYDRVHSCYIRVLNRQGMDFVRTSNNEFSWGLR